MERDADAVARLLDQVHAADDHGNDGRCGTPDEVGPRTTVTNLKQGQVFRTKKGPTGIRGTTDVADDPAGLKDVKLRLTRVLTVKVKVKPKKRKKKK